MPQRPPLPAVGATTWRLTDLPVALPEAQAFSLRQSLLLATSAGFLAGYYVLPNQWFQLAWAMVLSVIWFMVGGLQDFTEGLRRDRWLIGMAGLVALLMLRSSVYYSPGTTVKDLWIGWGNSALLMGYALMLWQAARLPRALTAIGKPLVAVAAAAAVGSVIMFYGMDSETIFGSRLQNWFVYGGWNSACTGLTFGFAATWAAWGWNAASEKRDRRRWLCALIPLTLACLFTLSRGVLLALVAGHVVLLLVRGWRRSWQPLVLLFSTILLFQLAGPLLSGLAVKDASARLGITDQAEAARMVQGSVVSSNPLRDAVSRADNGRFGIYSAALGSMTTWQDWVLGKGLWADDDCWSCSLHWYPEHLHGVLVDAWVHGGLPGALALLGLIVWGWRRAIELARQGEDLWIMLAGFGCAGLMFDGDSAFALLTMPRYEPLLLWAPLIMASARFTQAAERA